MSTIKLFFHDGMDILDLPGGGNADETAQSEIEKENNYDNE